MTDPIVQAKARAARKWVAHANEHTRAVGGQPWRYVLVTHDAVAPSASLAGLVARFGLTADLADSVAAATGT